MLMRGGRTAMQKDAGGMRTVWKDPEP